MARPPDADSSATYDRILTAANEQAATQGIGGLSLRSVAQKAGVSVGTLVYYFGNKAGLIEACLDAAYAWLRKQSLEAIARIVGGADIEEEIRRLARVLFRRARAHRPLLHLRMLTTIQGGGLPKQRLDGDLVHIIEQVDTALVSRSTGALRLATHTFEMVVLRYAAHEDRELLSISGRDTIEEALVEVERHLEEVSVHIFRSAGVSLKTPNQQ